MADEKQQDQTPEEQAELEQLEKELEALEAEHRAGEDDALDVTTDDAPTAEPKQPTRQPREKAKAESKARPKVKPKPKAATPPVYRGDRVEIDGDEFIVRAVHGAGRVSLEGDEHPYTLWSPDEYEITRGKADREAEAREARKAAADDDE